MAIAFPPAVALVLAVSSVSVPPAVAAPAPAPVVQSDSYAALLKLFSEWRAIR